MSKTISALIENGQAILGIEFGSTRIKGVLIDEKARRSLPEAMSGKTAWRMEYGHIRRMTYGKAFMTATGTLRRMLKRNTALRSVPSKRSA